MIILYYFEALPALPRSRRRQVVNLDVRERSYWGVVYGTTVIVQQVSVVAATVTVPVYLHEVTPSSGFGWSFPPPFPRPSARLLSTAIARRGTKAR
jgi:hypothetical protein